MSTSEHRAFVDQADDGTWLGGCRWCRTSFVETDQSRAWSWVAGHDSAVACQRDVARRTSPTFAPTGPEEALSLAQLRATVAGLIQWFGGEAEVLMAADAAPLLFVHTPPTEEGWHRELLATVHVDTGAVEVPPPEDAIGGASGGD